MRLQACSKVQFPCCRIGTSGGASTKRELFGAGTGKQGDMTPAISLGAWHLAQQHSELKSDN